MRGTVVRVVRIMLRDLGALVSRRTWWLAALGPVLLGLFVGLMGAFTALLLSLAQASDIGTQPLGKNEVAVVGLGALPPALRTRAEAVLAAAPALYAERRGAVGYVWRGRRWLKALRGEPAEEVEAGAPASEAPVFERVDGPEGPVVAQLPGRWDAALVFSAEGERLAYVVRSEPAILYSRIMGERLGGMMEAWNLGEARRASGLQVEDHPLPGADPWALGLGLLLWTLGITYTYHGVAVQSVAGLFAGERETRTLEVLLALPIGRRELVWGKLLALVGVVLAPTALWVAVGAGGVEALLPVDVALPVLMGCAAAVVLPLSAVGCVISATAATTEVAQSRLGLANLGVMVVSVGVFAAARALDLGVEGVVSGVVSAALGAGGGAALGGLLLGSVALTTAFVEIAARGLEHRV